MRKSSHCVDVNDVAFVEILYIGVWLNLAELVVRRIRMTLRRETPSASPMGWSSIELRQKGAHLQLLDQIHNGDGSQRLHVDFDSG